MPAALQRSDLARSEPIRRLNGRNRTKADLLVYRHDGIDVAVKDYASRSWPVRQILGRFFIRRESRAYEAARGIAGLPPWLGRIDPFALATHWIDGARPLSSLTGVDRDCLDRLETILDSLHARGIAVTDLHHRNVLIDEQGSVVLIDLACAYVAGEKPRFLRRKLFELLRDLDLLALARMRARQGGDDPEALAATLDSSAATWHRRGRRLKRWIKRLRGRA